MLFFLVEIYSVNLVLTFVCYIDIHGRGATSQCPTGKPNTEKGFTMNYFSDCSTVAEIKALYKTLAKKHHPDLGGDAEKMKDLNSQYHDALKGNNGKESEGRKYSYNKETEQEIMDVLDRLMSLKGLEIELIGIWIWISGDTKENKEALKEAGCRWHSKRKVWFYKPKGYKKIRYSKGSLDELAAKYGSEMFKSGQGKKRKVLTN